MGYVRRKWKSRLFCGRISGGLRRYVVFRFSLQGRTSLSKAVRQRSGIPVFPEQGVPQPVQALDYEGGFLRRICDKVFLFLHLACLLCASIIYGGEDSRKCAIFRLGLSHEAPTILDFFGEIYSSAAKNLDFMRVCESVVMNIGTTPYRFNEPIGFFCCSKNFLFRRRKIFSKKVSVGFCKKHLFLFHQER